MIKRLRNKVTALFLLVAVTAIAGSTILTTRAYLADKRNYVMELNSIAAPNIAQAVSRYIENLEKQLSFMGTEAGFSVPAKLPDGIFQLDLYESGRFVASIPGSNRERESPNQQPIKDAEMVWALTKANRRQLFVSGSFVVLSVPLNNKLFLAWMKSQAFSEYLELARALSVLLVSREGTVLAANSMGASLSLQKEIVGELTGTFPSALGNTQSQTVMVKETVHEDGASAITAVAQLAAIPDVFAVTSTPGAKVTALVLNGLKDSLPFLSLIFLVTIGMGVLFAAQLAGPIEALTHATTKIAGGQWEVLVKFRSRDEIGRLVMAFSRMAKQLESREAALRRANEDLVKSERLAVLGKFSAGIAHEVKNPLSSILGYAQLVERQVAKGKFNTEAGSDSTVPKYLGFIMDETRRAAKIISDLLMFARQKPPALSSHRIKEVIDRAYDLMVSQADSLGVKLVKKIIDDDALAANLDREQLYQVLSNLITNSFHALEGKAQGESLSRIGREEKKVILSLSRSDDGKHALISVSDNGSGISKDDLPKLFEPFFSTKEVGKGSGLGLALCHGIVSQHGGKIEVSSELGRGTKFTVWVPLTAS